MENNKQQVIEIQLAKAKKRRSKQIRNSYKYKHFRGFSLNELIIVIAIIGVMTSVILVSLSNSKTTKALENASQEVAAAIREAQNNALSGGQFSGNEKVACGHGFYFDATESEVKYYIYNNFYDSSAGTGDCLSVEKKYSSSSNITEEYSLKNDVTFSLNSKADFYFEIPHALIYDDGSPFGSSVKSIHLTKDSKDYYICVYTSGNIVENKTNPNCP